MQYIMLFSKLHYCTKQKRFPTSRSKCLKMMQKLQLFQSYVPLNGTNVLLYIDIGNIFKCHCLLNAVCVFI